MHRVTRFIPKGLVMWIGYLSVCVCKSVGAALEEG